MYYMYQHMTFYQPIVFDQEDIYSQSLPLYSDIYRNRFLDVLYTHLCLKLTIQPITSLK
jgi:hypothetical protein